MHAEPDFIPEEDEPAVTPGDDSNDDPTPPLPADPAPGAPERNPAVDKAQAANDGQPGKQELAIDNERDIPSDGRDLQGERMIRDLEKPLEPARDRAQAA